MKAKYSQQTLESMSQAVWYNRWTLNKFKKYLKGDILEVGCGIGNFTSSLTKYGRVWAIDIEKNYVEETMKKVNGKASVGMGNIEQGKYFFNTKKFNSVVCVNVLEHIGNDKQALKNLYKLLEDREYLILLVPSHPKLYGAIDQSIGHFRRYDKNDLINKLKDVGFAIVSFRRVNFLGAIGWWIAQKILREKTIKEDNIKIFNVVAPLVLPLEDIMEPPLGTSILVIAQKKS